ncbi:hypothetical protein RRG08_046869 [Elysia crispata]|uniref:Uncharacterized protein n=1 Tax=Elysia crispata TaxID=231223 RepID=A0AAE0ZHY9_9GAST|nr:hypothetical protein RRG08_046869 [Elysia crispata]
MKAVEISKFCGYQFITQESQTENSAPGKGVTRTSSWQQQGKSQQSDSRLDQQLRDELRQFSFVSGDFRKSQVGFMVRPQGGEETYGVLIPCRSVEMGVVNTRQLIWVVAKDETHRPIGGGVLEAAIVDPSSPGCAFEEGRNLSFYPAKDSTVPMRQKHSLWTQAMSVDRFRGRAPRLLERLSDPFGC